MHITTKINVAYELNIMRLYSLPFFLSLLFNFVSHVSLCFVHSFPIPATFICQLRFLVILDSFSVLQFSYLCLLFTFLLS